jgi:hypothetical protein
MDEKRPSSRKATKKIEGMAFARLLEAVTDAYTYSSLRIMVRIYLRIRLEHVAHVDSRSLIDIAFDLIEWANREDRQRDLIDGAFQANPGNLKLQNFKDWFESQESAVDSKTHE